MFLCSDCYFRIEVSVTRDSIVIIGVNLKNVVSQLSLEGVAGGTIMQKQDVDCYDIQNKLQSGQQQIPSDKTPYIIQAYSFLEHAHIFITDKFNNTENMISYKFQKDIVIKVYYMELKNKLICVSPSIGQTSYTFSLLREDEIEKYQRYNFLINGMSIYGYLPGNNVTTYKHMKMDMASNNLNLNLKVVKGNPVLFAYVCKDYNDCIFEKNRVETYNKTGSLLASSKVNNNYHINIPNEVNACYLKSKESGKDSSCVTLAIVYCQGSTECEYLISMNFDNDAALLQEKVKTSRFVGKGNYNYYKIINIDPDVKRITVITHSHSGDSDLYGSRKDRRPENDIDRLTSATAGNRDIIEFEKNDSSNSTMLGEFYVSVKGFSASYYTIYYYTTKNSDVVNNYRVLESGYILSEVVKKSQGIQTFKFYNRDISLNTPYLITFNPINCDGEVYHIKNDISSAEPAISFKLDYSYHHSQYLVTKDQDFYSNSNGYNFGFKVTSMDSGTTSDSDDCLIYVGGVEKGRELVLNEGVPHIYTIESDGVISYVYPHAFDGNSAIIYIHYEQAGKLTVLIRIGNSETSYDLIKSKGILVTSDMIKQNCNTNLCNIHIGILSDRENTSPINYRILGKSSNNKPIYLSKGLIKHDSTTPSIYQYYYTDVSKNDSGVISLQVKHGSAVLVAKLVKKGAPAETMADYNGIKLPKINDVEINLYYNPTTMSISFNSTDTQNCDNGCQIYFGVYSQDKFSFNDYLVDYSILVKLDGKPTNLPLDYNVYGQINNTDTLNYYQVKVKDNSDNISFTVDCLENPCEVYVSFGDRIPSKSVNIWSFSVNANERNTFVISTTDHFLVTSGVNNLKNTMFTLAIGSSNINSIQYHLYTTIHKLGVQPIYEITPGTPQMCETTNNGDYCDFMLHLTYTSEQKLAFYPMFMSSFRTRDHGVKYYASVTTIDNYNKIKSGSYDRPREGRSSISSLDQVFEYTSNGKEHILLLSVQVGINGTFNLLSTLISDFYTPLKLPKMGMDYLVYLPPAKSTEIHIESGKSYYMARLRRLQGVGRIEYKSSKAVFSSFVIDKNSTTTQVSIQEDNVDIALQNGNQKENLILVFKYEPNTNHNLDAIHLGPTQTIFYPNDKGGFPINYYLPLKWISMDVTVNIRIKHITYEKRELDDNDLHYEHDITARVVDKVFIDDWAKNKKITGLPTVHGFYKGHYDASLRTGRLTIPAGKYNQEMYALISLHQLEGKPVRSFTIQVLAFPENSVHYNLSLPQKNYLYSMIDTNSTLFDKSNENKVNNGHVYKLTREHTEEKFMVIELASCSGSVDYALRDVDPSEEILIDKNPKLLLNKTKHMHTSYEHFGKRMIEVDLSRAYGDKDLILVVFPQEPRLEFVCLNLEECYYDTQVGYAVRYRTFLDKEDFEKYSLLDKGLISSSIRDDKSIYVNAERVEMTNINYIPKVSYYVRLFDTNKYNQELSQYYSICFAQNIAKVYKFDNHPSRNNGFILDPITKDGSYVVSILARTEDSGDNYGSLLVYSPTSFSIRTGTSGWVTGKKKTE
jgi:hypothetical protein